MEACTYLLGRGANPNAVNQWGFVPLFSAIKNDHLNVVELLLRDASNIHLTTLTGDSAIHLACYTGNVEMWMTVLLAGGWKDVFKCNHDGVSPVLIAERQGFEAGFREVAQELKEKAEAEEQAKRDYELKLEAELKQKYAEYKDDNAAVASPESKLKTMYKKLEEAKNENSLRKYEEKQEKEHIANILREGVQGKLGGENAVQSLLKTVSEEQREMFRTPEMTVQWQQMQDAWNTASSHLQPPWVTLNKTTCMFGDGELLALHKVHSDVIQIQNKGSRAVQVRLCRPELVEEAHCKLIFPAHVMHIKAKSEISVRIEIVMRTPNYRMNVLMPVSYNYQIMSGNSQHLSDFYGFVLLTAISDDESDSSGPPLLDIKHLRMERQLTYGRTLPGRRTMLIRYQNRRFRGKQFLLTQRILSLELFLHRCMNPLQSSADMSHCQRRVREFVQVARLLQSLQHPQLAISTGLSVFSGNELWTFEDYAPMGALDTFLHNAAAVPLIPVALQVQVLEQVAQGLHALSCADIVHESLRASNVMLLGSNERWHALLKGQSDPELQLPLLHLADIAHAALDGDPLLHGRWRYCDPLLIRWYKEHKVGSTSMALPRIRWGLKTSLAQPTSSCDIYAMGTLIWESVARSFPYESPIESGLSDEAIMVGICEDDWSPLLCHWDGEQAHSTSHIQSQDQLDGQDSGKRKKTALVPTAPPAMSANPTPRSQGVLHHSPQRKAHRPLNETVLFRHNVQELQQLLGRAPTSLGVHKGIEMQHYLQSMGTMQVSSPPAPASTSTSASASASASESIAGRDYPWRATKLATMQRDKHALSDEEGRVKAACADALLGICEGCWNSHPSQRPSTKDLLGQLGFLLEQVTQHSYSYSSTRGKLGHGNTTSTSTSTSSSSLSRSLRLREQLAAGARTWR